MKSKASIGGHPIHPMVVVFPIALFTATVATLLAFIGTQDTFWYRAAMTAGAAGVSMALLAAIPGAIDLFSLPKDSPARATGMKHASFAVLTIGIFAASTGVMYRNWMAKTNVDGIWQLDATVPLAIGVAGMVTLVIVGILGWTMVQTHHLGIKPTFVRPAREARIPDFRGTAFARH
ncbi:MAG: DUF2231 domain-containing protein [Myxococcota bacterium]|nr:DUF2231 domain-containing protein [Myxococcota bacterium]